MSRWSADFPSPAPLGPVAKPLFSALMTAGQGWKGTPSELLELLRSQTRRQDWWQLPEDVGELVDALNRLRYRLLAFGFGYSPNPFDGATAITFRPLNDDDRARVRRGRQAWKAKQAATSRA